MNPAKGERAFVEWVRQQARMPDRVTVGPGDDAAAVRIPGATELLVTTDMLMEGACFRLAEAGPRRVGRKAIAVNLSDIAAMAGRPLAAVASVALPRTMPHAQIQELFLGMKEMADEFDTAIIGGDTNSWDGELAISITLLGEATARGPVKRSGAKLGDWILVTGPLGGSILGHHLDFTPRIREALHLHQCVELHAMIDISDGLALDLHRMCDESGCGAILEADQVPINDAARQMKDDKSALDHALGDGEDFELLMAIPAPDARQLLANTSRPSWPLFHIGEVIERGVWINEGGQRRALPALGYEHSFN